MIFLYYNLIKDVLERNFKYFFFGISILNRGKYLDEGLVIFKEGFGLSVICNRIYYKNINKWELCFIEFLEYSKYLVL